MNHISMAYDERNTEHTGAKWIYNEVNPCDTSIMINKTAADRIKIKKVIGEKHTLAIGYVDGEDKGIIITMHLQTQWETARSTSSPSTKPVSPWAT